jgi:hypothetical protein
MPLPGSFFGSSRTSLEILVPNLDGAASWTTGTPGDRLGSYGGRGGERSGLETSSGCTGIYAMTGRKCGKEGTSMVAACSEEGISVCLVIKGSVRCCWLGAIPPPSRWECCSCGMGCPGCACDPRSFPMLDGTLIIDGTACAMSDRKDMSVKVGLKKRRMTYQMVGRDHLASHGVCS